MAECVACMKMSLLMKSMLIINDTVRNTVTEGD